MLAACACHGALRQFIFGANGKGMLTEATWYFRVRRLQSYGEGVNRRLNTETRKTRL